MGYARMAVSPELLCQALNLPEGTAIVGARWDESRFVPHIELIVGHEELPHTLMVEGEQPPEILPVFLSGSRDSPPVMISWDDTLGRRSVDGPTS